LQPAVAGHGQLTTQAARSVMVDGDEQLPPATLDEPDLDDARNPGADLHPARIPAGPCTSSRTSTPRTTKQFATELAGSANAAAGPPERFASGVYIAPW
jgi:hypothetical protein